MRIYNANGVAVIEYTYDAWGNYKKTKLIGSTSADRNGLLYRGYYYDSDLGLYYLGSRYYDASIGRFINTDELVAGIGGEMRGNNLYVYAFNNPIMYSDFDGNWPSWNEFVEWGKSAIDFIAYAVETAYYNLEITAGITVGMGGEFALGKISIEAGSRMDILGVQFKDGNFSFGREGRSAACITIMGFTIGPQSDTYEDFGGEVKENDDPYYLDYEPQIPMLGSHSAAFIIGYQYGVSFSMKDYIAKLALYSRG